MISKTFVQFQTSSLFPKFLKKVYVFRMHSNFLYSLYQPAYGAFHLTETMLFSQFVMTSTSRWIRLRSIQSSRLIRCFWYLSCLVFKIDPVLTVFFLVGSSLISHVPLSSTLHKFFYLCILHSFLWSLPCMLHVHMGSCHSISTKPSL